MYRKPFIFEWKAIQVLKLRPQNFAQYAEDKQPMGLVPWDI
jgi:hypothetical protein